MKEMSSNGERYAACTYPVCVTLRLQTTLVQLRVLSFIFDNHPTLKTIIP